MPDPVKRPPVGSGKQFHGISRTWWVVGGVGAVGVVYYAYRKQSASAVVPADPTIDPNTGLSMDGGSSGIPSGAGAVGITPPAATDPFSNIPTGSTVTYTGPDGSTTTIQEPLPGTTVPTGSTTGGGSSGGVDSSGGTTTTSVAPAPKPAFVNPAKQWQNGVYDYFTKHHYHMSAVKTAIGRYELGLPLNPDQLAIVQAAIYHFGALIGAPPVHLAPPAKHPKPKTHHTGRQKAHH